MDKYKDNVKLLNVVMDIYWSIITFLILHELSHIYLNRESSNVVDAKLLRKQEYESDELAYKNLLNLIYNRKNIKMNYNIADIFEEYTYLSPLIFVDLVDLVKYVSGEIDNERYVSEYPSQIHRKENLLNIFDKWENDIDTEEGNAIYYWFIITIIEKFKNNLYNANEFGKLNKIKRKKGNIINIDPINQLEQEIKKEVSKYNAIPEYVDEQYVENFIDKYVYFLMDDDSKDFIIINLKNDSTLSFKLSNIIIEFKGMIKAMIEFGLTSAIPADNCEEIKIILYIIYKIFDLSLLQISKNDVMILRYLHTSNAYEIEVKESDLIDYFSINNFLNKMEVHTSINNLIKIKCIDILNEKIRLKEKIFLR